MRKKGAGDKMKSVNKGQGAGDKMKSVNKGQVAVLPFPNQRRG